MDTRFAHGIGAVSHALFAAAQTTVILKEEPHLVVVSFREEKPDFPGGSLRGEPRLDKNVVQKISMFGFHLTLLWDDSAER